MQRRAYSRSHQRNCQEGKEHPFNEYYNYVRTGEVEPETVDRIVNKLVLGESLTPEELAMREGAAEEIESRLSEAREDAPEGTVDVEAETPVTQDPVTEAPFNVEEYHTTEELKAEYERLGPVRDEILLTPEFESEEEARGYYVDEIRRLTEEAPATEAATPEVAPEPGTVEDAKYQLEYWENERRL